MTVIRSIVRGLWQHLAAAVLVAGVTASPAVADAYPTRPVTILTPFAAGSVTDSAARLIGQYHMR